MKPSRKARRLADPAPSAPAPLSPLAAFGTGRAVFVAASAVILIPCMWHSRIQAGDLGSHIYNSWLAQLIHEGRAPGLSIAPQITNVLFDLLLYGLFRAFGSNAAQHLASMAAVLVFVWGAFAFVSTLARRRAWDLLPLLAVLAYGWVFHMGLFDFYLSLGLCFWALALAWNPGARRMSAAAALLVLAYVGHALPVAWAVGLLAYRWVAGRLNGRRRWYLFAACIVALIAVHAAMAATMRTNWSIDQILLSTGADQAVVFDAKYRWIAFAVAALWAWHILPMRKSLPAIPFQFCLLTAAAIFIVPTWAWLPHYQHALVFIAERMSLALGVCICAVAALAPAAPWRRRASVAAAVAFFAMLYADEGVLNEFENSMEETVAQLPPGQRVVSAIQIPGLRTGPIDHMIDRICIGRCWSYANYEPSSGAFRIRVTGATTIIAPTDADSSRMQNGGYAVKPRDLPLIRLQVDAAGRIVPQSMPVGALIGMSYWNGL